MRVFFYGLFMDENLLAEKGIQPSEIRQGFVDGFELRIGERATLVPRSGGRAYGLVMEVATDALTRLYTAASVADYLPAPVTVDLTDGTQEKAICYILPAAKVTGTNRTYAKALLHVATKLAFPDSYLDEIRKSVA